jgi:hypothetical protein
VHSRRIEQQSVKRVRPYECLGEREDHSRTGVELGAAGARLLAVTFDLLPTTVIASAGDSPALGAPSRCFHFRICGCFRFCPSLDLDRRLHLRRLWGIVAHVEMVRFRWRRRGTNRRRQQGPSRARSCYAWRPCWSFARRHSSEPWQDWRGKRSSEGG